MASLEILDHGKHIVISFEDILKYHGGQFPGGVAHGFKVMERAFALLSPDQPPDRHAVTIETAFPGPGARDAFEMVTRAVTGGRYRLDFDLAPAEAVESAKGAYFFRVGYRDKSVDLRLRPGIVRAEFIALSRKAPRTAAEEQRLTYLKQEMADRIMATVAAEVYEEDRG